MDANPNSWFSYKGENMKKYKALILADWGTYDGGIEVRQIKYPEPDPPRLKELFAKFLEKELDVIVSDNEICFTIVRTSCQTVRDENGNL